ncbi:hypothetical protein [Bacillus mojavensis]|uniref:hypothetical protein n=1 Tax=Bacillus mojavensis TaxID=72360 RepID=UPI002DB667CC|nr:hypothetical protein [Bacillus mojavensis]MEC1612762.1 hypothetical protein [Bacillus mojavensis]MEC1622849.1 hypothetical protein [Bacillus mojavensis]MEC1636567.1 hypothetical protein [Bacillus mojavensis]MEC1659215.1 hypothetical protein [Bacillus mojavensis]MEC1685283.1 hypothetical protein [Bacillus mojavensis]
MLGKIKAAIDNSPGKPEKIAVNESAFQQLKEEMRFVCVSKPKTIMGIPVEVSDDVEGFELRF